MSQYCSHLISCVEYMNENIENFKNTLSKKEIDTLKYFKIELK